MNFENKVVVITGGAHGIGLCTAEEFKKYGAHVCVIDSMEGDHYVGDISNINISSSRDRMSQPQTESYTAAKGGIATLTHALAVSFAG